MVIGTGYEDRYLSEAEVRELVSQALAEHDLTGKRVLVIIPDHTRTAPIPLFFRLFHELLGERVAALDYLVALGTHQPMDEEALHHLVGITAEEHRQRYAGVHIFNHRWDLPDTFTTIGVITEHETRNTSNGMLSLDVPVRINKMILDYDQLIICGPVFPHEVVGFSGGNKYFFPGIGGQEVINFTHWLGAVITSMAIIGTKHTPVRQVIDRAASFIDRPTLCFSLVVQEESLAGLFIGTPEEAWSAAADLSAKLHVIYVDKPFRRVLSIMPEMYDHVRDYFLKQWDRFKDYPWGVLAHSTHLRGVGTYDAKTGIEKPRIQVTLATGIPEERCRRIGLGYLDPATIDPAEWEGREDEGILVVHKAGEKLYRISKSASQRPIVSHSSAKSLP